MRKTAEGAPLYVQRIPPALYCLFEVASASLWSKQADDSFFHLLSSGSLEDAGTASVPKQRRQMKKIAWAWELIPCLSYPHTPEINYMAIHRRQSEVWHNWAVPAVLTSLLFLMASISAITTRGEGKVQRELRTGISRKSKTVGQTVAPVELRFPGQAMSLSLSSARHTDTFVATRNHWNKAQPTSADASRIKRSYQVPITNAFRRPHFLYFRHLIQVQFIIQPFEIIRSIRCPSKIRHRRMARLS